MFKKTLFDEDSEEEVTLKTENEYAKKYDAWREKEEIHKLEQKYGPKALNSDGSVSTDSEDESDEPPEVDEETEKQFLKTLALLKTKDPRIYDNNYKFFEDKKVEQAEKEEKPKTLTFGDSEDDDDGGDIFTIEKKAEIQEDNTEDNINTNKKKEKLRDFLTGKADHIEDDAEGDLAPLKALWSDPKLPEGEAFLRDYILNKRYLEPGSGALEDKLRDDEALEADERRVDEQQSFERAYNFRFEEPDDEYLKRFPRTMNSIRPKDDKRSRKRAEVRARKEDEKKKKMEEIGRLKALKLKEIQQKIARIKEVTGNEHLAFEEQDIEGDFDPAEHDRRMRAIFDAQFYGHEDKEKPVFPDLDEELEIENWENYEVERAVEKQGDAEPHCEDEDFNMDAEYDSKQARMNLLEEIQKNLGKKRRNRKKKSKLGKLLSKEKPKFVPTIADKTYDEYMEEYYKMDCEDVIGGDLPTRFKYRDVVPNDFGLSIEEILLADDKELTQWVPLKKIVKHRPENVERGEVKTYQQKAQDQRLKRKMLPSLFKNLPEVPEIVVPIEETGKKKKKDKNKTKKVVDASEQNGESLELDAEESAEDSTIKTKKKKKKRKELNESVEITENYTDADENISNVNKHDNEESEIDSSKVKKKKHKKRKEQNESAEHTDNTNEDLANVNKNENKSNILNQESTNNDNQAINLVQKKKKHKKSEETTEVIIDTVPQNINEKKRKKNKQKGFIVEDISNEEPSKQRQEATEVKTSLKRKLDSEDNVPNKKKKNKNKQNNESFKSYNKKNNQKHKFKIQNKETSDNPLSNLSDERLKAYGLNPKKYKNFLKFKKF